MEKNEAAAILGRLGGLARNKKLSRKRKRAIAQKAARARAEQLSKRKRRAIARLGGLACAAKRRKEKQEKSETPHEEAGLSG